jgi:ABC-type Fe3+ transport system permease subunit/sugar lactone lactonase YvrE
MWVVAQIALNPTTLAELRLDSFRLSLLARTVLYNFSVAVVAVLLASPIAIVLGRGRGFFASALWAILPIGLLLPSLVMSYGWSQAVRLSGAQLEPAGFWDVSRCIWSLATWLYPIPAIVMGIALRRSDSQVQLQSLLDGALRRTIVRELTAPALASGAIVMVLAMQEFAVYEPTGISVVATEVRMVFETGAFSSADNPITQPMNQAHGLQSVGLVLPDQRARAAAAVATALPLIVVTAILSLLAVLWGRRLHAVEQVEPGAWPRALDAPQAMIVMSWMVMMLTLLVPLAALVLSLKRPLDPARIWGEFGPQTRGSILGASLAGAVALLLGISGSVSRASGSSMLATISFLAGGQLVAIALIRIYNRPWLAWAYTGAPVIVLAYLSRFAWIALAAAGSTWRGPWRGLRELAALDGATPWQTVRHVVAPLAWPVLLAAGVCVTILSLSEVAATVLIAPQRPQVLVPMLMTWVHMLRYDAMIEASLMMVVMVIVLGAVAIVLIRIGRRFAPRQQASDPNDQQTTNDQRPMTHRARTLVIGFWSLIGHWCLVICASPVALLGCSRSTAPDAVWLDTGNGPGQTVYPRGIAYAEADDSFFVVDRQARIQHLDREGRFIAEWQTPKHLQGKPVGLTVGPDGNLYVPDTHYYRVLVYAPDGSLLHEWGTRGTGPGQFIYPTDVAFDSKGRIFVSEYGDHDRIQVFDSDGKYLFQFGSFGDGPGQFSRPQSMVIDDSLVYVADACNHRIAVYTTDGQFVRNMGSVGSCPGEFRFPYGLSIDSQKNLIVCEFGNNRVQKIDPKTGAGLAIWGRAGRAPGELAYPWGVAVDKHDRVVAVDAGNNRLQVFEF